ncbi:phosphatidylinositol-4-phosphate 5-kinase, putative [Plasmodium berghei]|uniref:Phosphatidylinositol-4-phosphate 5-kinase, putative n=2 Tax=Plasmodium berghei TaxID=5821 RepID=A0A509APV6_PLABA|nr:phosphatidylinositol-4-phosphate 5-kinase, putative [Plasmodium berghei ANKA]CXI42393.1 phosphatidylinositol-4-phosphate 5-kinase, putative [Plasmodium berghei]VUC55727.1 phosphatidylinositol-4-phosphate 5-kinase, putative [Plasmodium berghei ANKA]|eukprot:XP_034421537.1 phosphatidylinositol-4-phosphate 5-kinase, putative [Plasmodium berghei ANKA]
MGNKCSCIEISNEKYKCLQDEGYLKTHGFQSMGLEGLETNIIESNEEDDYFYRYENKKSGIDQGEEMKENETTDCIVNVKRILNYIKEYESDFLLFFNEKNSTSLIFLKYIIMNYITYIMYIDTGVIYIGEINENNEKNGLGIIITPDQCIYIGEFDNDKITGFGLYIHYSKSKYIGYWKYGKANSYGIFIHPDGTFYKGLWLNDKQNKKGIEYVNNNYIFLGNYVKGEKNGFGAFIWKNESIYIGHIKNNFFNKRGIYFLNKNKIYISKWKYNCLHGKCEIFWIDKRQYLGHHINNNKQGIGIYKWNDGRIYFGNWSNNKQDGHGIFIIIKNFKNYENYINNPFFLFFKNTQKIKKYFLLNIKKEEFLHTGQINQLLQKIENNCHSYNFYYFLLTLLHINYYELCSSYFEFLRIKKLNNFKYNFEFYRKINTHISSATNEYIIGNLSGDNPQISNSIFWLNPEEKFNKDELTDKKKIKNGEAMKQVRVASNFENITYTYEKEGNTTVPLRYEQNENDFEDIENLKNYLNSINLSYINENDINMQHPLFSYASNNIIVKWGKWKNGELQNWIYSTEKDLNGENAQMNPDQIMEYSEEIIGKNIKEKTKKKKKKKKSDILFHNNYNIIDNFLNNLSSSALSNIYNNKKNAQKKKRTQTLMKKKITDKNNKIMKKQSEESSSEKENIWIDELKKIKRNKDNTELGINMKGNNKKGIHKDENKEKKKKLLHTSSSSTSVDMSTESESLNSFDMEGTKIRNQTEIGNNKNHSQNTDINISKSSSSIEMKKRQENEEPNINTNKEKGFYNNILNKNKINDKSNLVNFSNFEKYHKSDSEKSNNDKDQNFKKEKNLRTNINLEFIKKNRDIFEDKKNNNYYEENIPSSKDSNSKDKITKRNKKKNGIIKHGHISNSYSSRKSVNSYDKIERKKKGKNRIKGNEEYKKPVISQNYDLPKKGFSLIWSLKKMKNAHKYAKDDIAFEAPEKSNFNEMDHDKENIKKTKQSFFKKILGVSKVNQKK